MSDWGGFWIALAMMFIAFSASNCRSGEAATDSIAQAVVKHLER
jgi:hypothetical protein